MHTTVYARCQTLCMSVQVLYNLIHGEVTVANRNHQGRAFAKVFIGCEAVDTLESRLFNSRESAVQAMQVLVDKNFCYHVMHPEKFQDKQMCYRFYEDYDFVIEHARQRLLQVCACLQGCCCTLQPPSSSPRNPFAERLVACLPPPLTNQGQVLIKAGVWHVAFVYCPHLQPAAPIGQSPFAALPLD